MIKKHLNIYLIIVLLIGLMPIIAKATEFDPTTWNDGQNWNPTSGNSWETAYAYELSIVMYNGTGEPQKIKNGNEDAKPILLYHPNIMREFYQDNAGDVRLPNSMSDMTSGQSWGLNQMLPQDNDPHTFTEWSGQNTALFHELPSMADVASTDTVVQTEYGDNYIVHGTLYYQLYSENCNDYNPKPAVENNYSTTKTHGEMPYQKYVLSFMTKRRRIKYKKPSTSAYAKIYEDSNLTENNILNGYLNKWVTEHANNLQNIEKYFKVNLDYSKFEQYYIQAIPVKRVKKENDIMLNPQRVFLASSPIVEIMKKKDGTQAKASTWQESDWEWEDANNCACGSKPYSDTYDSANLCSGNCAVDHPGGTCSGSVCSWSASGGYSCPCGEGTTNGGSYHLTKTVYCGKKAYIYLYGKYVERETELIPVRDGIWSKRALNNCNDQQNQHCELEDDGVTCKKDVSGKEILQYYIGPNLEDALVGNKNKNYYQINGDCNKGKKDEGIRHWYAIDLIDCPQVCEKTCDLTKETLKQCKRTDKYLKCAENYCEASVDIEQKGNPRNRKKNCILTACGYKYGKSPTQPSNLDAPDLESVNSCNNSNPYKGLDKILNASSTCNKDDTSNKYMQDINATITSCISDKVTDFDGNDTNDTIFDQRTYITTACKETTSFKFSDISNIKYVAGQGIDYQVKQTGKKECTYKFNLEQWKFDYASIPGKEKKELRRKRLKLIYDMYNHAMDSTYKPSSSPYYLNEFAGEKYGEINWKENIYKVDRETVTSKVSEVINNKLVPQETETLVDIVKMSTPEHHVGGNQQTLVVVAKNNIDKTNYKTNVYKSIDKHENVKEFKSRCISTDGKANIYFPDDSNICYNKKTGIDNTPVYGKNLYYTNLSATPNAKFSSALVNAGVSHNIETKVTVGKNVASEETPYYKDQEVCKYKIGEGNIRCEINITPSSGTESLGNNVYEGGNVTAKVIPTNLENLEKGDEIETVKMKIVTKNLNEKIVSTNTYTGTQEGVTQKIEMPSDKDSIVFYDVQGTVLTKKGKEVTCLGDFKMLKHTPTCNVKCDIVENSKTKYQIVSKGKDTPNKYYISLLTNMNPQQIFQDGKGKYYVVLDQPLSINNDILFGYVEKTGDCNDYCYHGDPPTPEQEKHSCTKEFKPIETGEIAEYCDKSWNTDINNYQSASDCFYRCSTICPVLCYNEQVVKDYCKNAVSLGYKDEAMCLNKCYCNQNINKDDKVYRSINNNNPFPYSNDSEDPYEKGNRLIGKNWYGLSKYIKNDDEDKTSITGKYANTKVEYIIDLGPNEIKNIRNNNSEMGPDVYTKYISKNGNYFEGITSYKSSFIHEEFRHIFKSRAGNVLVDHEIED